MDESVIKEILENSKVIAVVGLSPKSNRPSHQVAAYLQKHGYRIIPVRPGINEVLGEKAYHSLKAIPSEIQVDVVDVFRKSQDVPPVVDQAIEIVARYIWLQEGIIHEEAAKKAQDAGLKVVMNLCMLKEHIRLF